MVDGTPAPGGSTTQPGDTSADRDPHQAAHRAAAELRDHTGIDAYDAAVIMGSGWAPAADTLGATGTELATGDLPGFRAPGASGHAGTIRSVTVGGSRLLVFLGRTHLYEGHGPVPVVHGVRTALAAGVRTVLLTNAAGGLRADYTVGQPVLVSDHINLTGRSPVSGPNFVDLTEAYSPRLRASAREVDASLADGVYAAMPGPHYETPAEIRMLRALGADLVGMSTVLETIAAREGGAQVLALSLVTNIAAGLSDAPLDHSEVLAAGRSAAADTGALLEGIVRRLSE
ncbi:purine-nucleoside phosphorylase [Lipingzhangella sp. LS1_29]|uniref:Purine nucleoside phosphorylase n=1 Tax=Lipingzhangella rawalii TaxID=2055835 RepID=A0ABU2H6R3_9ACTN|nr:purine-nucleoside phosphorylase [Lipingzhangella rawalii]MDS1270998.1 purine-nucleoside phosphorylase [Lipingzhangella rawalii]